MRKPIISCWSNVDARRVEGNCRGPKCICMDPIPSRRWVDEVENEASRIHSPKTIKKRRQRDEMRYETAQHVCFSIIYELHIVCMYYIGPDARHNFSPLLNDFTFNQLIICCTLENVVRCSPLHSLSLRCFYL